ncbi:hypothetical protein [Lentzea kentuckyensis]|uniref:hypothetical protein n=1 Tax=Lentzea kentuckyensis TaxID=360086 RepID=UPI000A3A01F5|nr:hypothetical protein [Lentzea kentuckyensis]
MAPVKPTVPPPNANYAGQPHEQLKGQVTNNFSPEAANTVIDAWKSIGDQFKELATDFTILVNGSQDGWKGRAAEGVRTALGKIGTFSDTTGDAMLRTSNAIAQQRDAAAQAKTSMPDPVSFSPSSIMGKWGAAAVISPVAMIGGPIELMQKHNEQKEAHQEAARVVQQRDNTMMAAAMSMPTMESTPQVTQDQGVTQTSSSTSSHSLSNVNANQRFSSNTTGMPSTPPGMNNGTTNPSWVAPQPRDPNLPNNLDPNRPGNNQNRPGFPGPGGFPPGRLPGGGGQGRPPGGGPGMRPGGPGAGGGRGMGAGGMGGPGAAGRGMGSFGPATPGGGAGVAGAGPGGPGAAGSGAGGRQGAAGAAGGGAGAGQGGQGQEDKEHKSNYLVPTDEFFDDDRMVAPPVIGG